MITIVALDSELGRRAVMTTTHDRKKAREMVKSQAGQPGSSIVRPTAYDLDTGHTIAGPGRLGPGNGRTERSKARRAMTPEQRKAARKARHAADVKRRKDRKLAAYELQKAAEAKKAEAAKKSGEKKKDDAKKK